MYGAKTRTNPSNACTTKGKSGQMGMRMQNLGDVNHKNTIAHEGPWNYPNSCDTFHKLCSKVMLVEVFHVTPSI